MVGHRDIDGSFSSKDNPCSLSNREYFFQLELECKMRNQLAVLNHHQRCDRELPQDHVKEHHVREQFFFGSISTIEAMSNSLA